MIKLICIDNSGFELALTINKIYEGDVRELDDGLFYKLNGNDYYYNTHRFIPLSEFREQRINSILND